MSRFVFKVWCLALPLFLCLLSFFIYKPHHTHSLLPIEDSSLYKIDKYSDSVKGRHQFSEISILSFQKDSISFKYSLSSEFPHPFAGLSFLSKKPSFVDLSDYDVIELEIKATQGKRPQILLGVCPPSNARDSFRDDICKYIVKDLDLIKGVEQYRIPLKEFVTPSWWYVSQGISEKDINEVEFSKLALVNIQNCQLLEPLNEDIITVKKVQLKKDISLFYASVFGGMIVYYITFVLIFIRNKPKAGQVEIRYTPVNAIQPSQLELEKLIAYISSHYNDSELSLKKIQTETGLPESKVSILLKNAFQLNFKQYLNRLRINEAKRLLKELELPVSDIAYKVGYGNVSHFNRVFKEHEGLSPNDFRKKDSIN